MHISKLEAPSAFSSQEDYHLFVEQCLNEQVLILKCLFLLYRKSPPSFDTFFQMLRFFDSQGFQGSFLFHNNKRHMKIQESFERQAKIAQIINDLSILIILGSLSLSKMIRTIVDIEIKNKGLRPFDLFYNGHGKSLFEFCRESENIMQISSLFIAFKSMAIYFKILSSKK